ncbi:hypothetical protein FNF31_06523 [Cafeteria roenbergensis]|nr:hypothetical protein FNF31_06523 [Cafeteria roenbergensis]
MLIGTKSAFPFSFAVNSSASPGFATDSAGQLKFSGFAWELFDRFLFPIASRFGSNFSTYRIVKFENNDQILRAVASGMIDAGHAAITKTPEREALVDFTTSWFDTGLSIMTRTSTGIPVDQAVATLTTATGVITSVVALVASAVLAMSIALFVLERAVPGPRPVMRKGCCSGIKDSGVLIMLLLAHVPVRIPSGMLSRPVAAMCSVSSSVLTIVVTAIATVALQSATNAADVTGIADLAGKSLLVPVASTAATFLDRNFLGAHVTPTATIDEALDRFRGGEGDAILYDEPVLAAFIGEDVKVSGSKRFTLVGGTFELQQYGIAISPDLGLSVRKAFNRAILSVYGTAEMDTLREHWFHTGAEAGSMPAATPSSITDFLAENFITISIIVGAVVGTALFAGLAAFCIRSTHTMWQSGSFSYRLPAAATVFGTAAAAWASAYRAARRQGP